MTWRKIDRWPAETGAWDSYTLREGAAARALEEDHLAARHGFSSMSDHEVARSYFYAFAYVVAKLSAGRDRLAILDYGGAMGMYVNIARQAASCPIDYVVEELPSIAAAGRQVRPAIQFTDRASGQFDLVLASGALQCVDDWRGEAARLASLAPFLFLTRVPMLVESPDYVTLQTLPQGDVAAWCWRERDLLASLGEIGLHLVEEFRFQESFVPIEGASELPRIRGYLLKRAS